MAVRVLIVDLPALMRRTLAARLSVEPDIEVVGEVDDVASAAGLACERNADVVLLDTEMPGLNVRQAIDTLLECGSNARIVVLTFDTPALLDQVGARAVVVGKHDGTQALVTAIRAASGPVSG